MQEIDVKRIITSLTDNGETAEQIMVLFGDEVEDGDTLD